MLDPHPAVLPVILLVSFADASGGDLQLGDGPLRALLPLQLAPPHGNHLQRVQGEPAKTSRSNIYWASQQLVGRDFVCLLLELPS